MWKKPLNALKLLHSQKRIINGIYKMMNSKEIGPVNLGNPDERSIMEIAEEIVKLTDSKSEFVFKTLDRKSVV